MDLTDLSNSRGDKKEFLSKERKSLSKIHLRCWLGLTSFIALCLSAQDAFERYREIRLFSDGLSTSLEAHLESDVPHHDHAGLSAHLEAYRNKANDSNGEFGTTATILLVDQRGTIIGSSIPSWKGYKIFDPTIRNPTNENWLLRRLINCYAGKIGNRIQTCRQSKLDGFSITGNLITTVNTLRPQGPSLQTYALVVNYDSSTLYTDIAGDLIIILVFSALVSFLAYWLPFRHLSRSVITSIYDTVQIDPLTRSANRYSFVERSLLMLEKAAKGGSPLSLVLFDISSFQKINSSIGTGQSDHVLVILSNTIIQNLEVTEFVLSRLEADIFACLMASKGTEKAFMEAVAFNFRLATKPYSIDNAGYNCKMGCVLTKSYGYNLDFLISRAKYALDNAKQESTSFVFFEGES